jgi:hypothetical protein
MTTHTATTTRAGWCHQCHRETDHVFAKLREADMEYHVDQCLACERWSA